MGRKGRSISAGDRARIVAAVVDHGLPVGEVAIAFEISRRSVSRLLLRYRREGAAGLAERSRRPLYSPQRTASALEQRVVQLRGQLGWGPARIGAMLSLSGSTVHRILCEQGLNNPAPPRQRFPRIESARPGELVHLDSMSLTPLGARRPTQHVFAAIDGYSREAFVQLYGRADAEASMCFLSYLLDSMPYQPEAVMTDNALIFTMRRSAHPERQCPFQRQLEAEGIRHVRTRPQTPRTNGKVERWFGTLSRELLRREHFCSEDHRACRLADFVGYYNQLRPHSQLGYLAPTPYRLNYFQQHS